MRLIDADALNREIDKVECYSRDPYVAYMSECIANAPTVDAEQVIRCKDCKFLRFTGTVWKCQNRLVMMLCEPNDFCSRAERKDE